MTLSRILCATDFSVGATAALRVGAMLAQEQQAELVITHAWSLPAEAYLEGYAFSPDVIERLTTEAQRGLDDAASAARSSGAKHVSTALSSGPPWRAITKMIADDLKIGLVVLGKRRQSNRASMLWGSVSTRVVRHGRCSVLVVHPEDSPASFDHILCAVDLSAIGWQALELAAELARCTRITLVHVVEAPVPYVEPRLTRGYLVDVERHAARELERWATQLRGLVGVDVATRMRVGDPGTEVLSSIAQDPSVDLVITGSHRRVGLERVLLGSVAEKIVRYARTPVLVARKHSA
jgi:nucleotide-binding universal stress UspA family protein